MREKERKAKAKQKEKRKRSTEETGEEGKALYVLFFDGFDNGVNSLVPRAVIMKYTRQLLIEQTTRINPSPVSSVDLFLFLLSPLLSTRLLPPPPSPPSLQYILFSDFIHLWGLYFLLAWGKGGCGNLPPLMSPCPFLYPFHISTSSPSQYI